MATPPTRLLLSIGGITGRLDVAGRPVFIAELRERYAPFLVPPVDAVPPTFSLSVDADVPARPAESEPEVVVTGGKRGLRISRWDFEARITDGARSTASCRPNRYSFDSLMRVLWTNLLAPLHGGLIHGCGIRDGGAGFLFPGVSGAGKTTLARKVPSREDVLSDELTPLRRAADGDWRVSASPFWGEFERGCGTLRSYPLAGVAFLRKGRRLAVSKLTPASAISRLLATLLFFRNDAASVRRNLAWATSLVTTRPCVEVTTTRRTPAAALLRALRDAGLTCEGREPDAREIISELREDLRLHGACTFIATGGSMRPEFRSGDVLFVRRVAPDALAAGDVVLYWLPGPTPAKDRLICHRVIRTGGRGLTTKGDAMSRFERIGERNAEVLGRVEAVTRDGATRRLGGRRSRIARVVASLAAIPAVSVREALR